MWMRSFTSAISNLVENAINTMWTTDGQVIHRRGPQIFLCDCGRFRYGNSGRFPGAYLEILPCGQITFQRSRHGTGTCHYKRVPLPWENGHGVKVFIKVFSREGEGTTFSVLYSAVIYSMEVPDEEIFKCPSSGCFACMLAAGCEILK